MRTHDQLQRMKSANELIKVIASCGRRFFAHVDDDGEKHVGYYILTVDKTLFFIDEISGYPVKVSAIADWEHFSDDRELWQTQRGFLLEVGDYILLGERYRMPPGFAVYWGYPPEDYKTVSDAAVRLGVAYGEP